MTEPRDASLTAASRKVLRDFLEWTGWDADAIVPRLAAIEQEAAQAARAQAAADLAALESVAWNALNAMVHAERAMPHTMTEWAEIATAVPLLREALLALEAKEPA